ncbi:DUF2840 domain-containing protein [Mesorhizobium sp. IMUNJ 23232]|uniref:DUF2840 domain-containing protein n=1 Tax=Mesorhizobium sp. IMUNJ 23232 TaxID=3376064 RepID=UPI0037A698DB
MTAGIHSTRQPADLTLVELTWREKKVEHRIRFGRIAEEHRLDRHRRIVSFAPGSTFAFVRWAGNEYGTVISRIDVVRAVAAGEPFQTLPFVRPGGDILLRLAGWGNVEIVLQAIDAIEALGIDPAEVAPDHWRHIGNRIAVHEPFRAYTLVQHRAWLRRRKVLS